MPGYHLPWFAAADTGVFERHGLDVTILDPAPGPANTHRVAAGDADFCLTSIAHYLRAWAEQPGVAARFMFAVTQRTHTAAYVVDGRRMSTGRIPLHPRDLDGARLGATDDSGFAKAYRRFARHTLGLADVPLVEMPYPDGMAALGEGRCDVFADFIDLMPRIQGRNPGVPLRAFRFADYGLSIYGSGMITSDRLIRERPDTVGRMAGAAREALVSARDQPEVGLASLLRRYPETDPAYAREGWRQSAGLIFGWEAERCGPGYFEADRWEETIRYEADIQGMPLPPPAATYDNQFVMALQEA